METGWLPDDGLLCVGATAYGFGMVSYTDPMAIRFARSEDAALMRAALVMQSRHHMTIRIDHTRPVEHSWG